MLRSSALYGSVSLLVLAASGFATGAAAQAAATVLDDVIVTAQKREQNLQDVPIVVTVVNARLLRDTGVRDIKDLTILTPGLIVTSTTSESSTTARIRGIGTVGDNPGLESSVGVVIDGVYRARNSVSFGDLGDMERIEVLKGPQGTLFGKSTSAGVINVITAEPSFNFGAKAQLDVGNYNAVGGSASVTGAIVPDALAGSLYFGTQKRDGFNDVVTGIGPRTDNEDANRDYYTVRGQLLYAATDTTRIRLIADYSHRDENCCGSVATSLGTAGATSRFAVVNSIRPNSAASVVNPESRLAYANRDYTTDVTDKGVSAQIDTDLGFADLTSITAFRSWESLRGQDSDFTAADIYYRPVGQYTDRFNTFSQELRLAKESGRLNWMVGGFFSNEDYRGDAPLIYGSDYYGYLATRLLQNIPAALGLTPAAIFQPGNGQRDSFHQRDKTFAVFTNDTLKLTDAWDITAGLRYTVDEKTVTSIYRTTGGSCAQGLAAFPTLVALAGASTAQTVVGRLCLPWEAQQFDARSGVQTATDKEWSGTLKSSYRFSPNVMAYASYARGYKAGGFNFDRPSQSFAVTPTGALQMIISPSTHFAPETVDAYEIGAKTNWLGGALQVNAAYFDQTYEDFQLNTFLGTQFIVESIPEVTSRGVDADFRWRTPLTGLSFQGGVTYAKTEYGKFTAADLTVPSRFPSLFRLPGATVSFAPEWSSSAAATYQHNIGNSLKGSVNVSAKYTSDYNTGSDLAPQKRQDAFTLVNARVALGSVDDRWTLEAWGQNITDEHYSQVVINAPLQGTEDDPANIRTYNAFLGAPATYGMTLRLSY